MTDLMGNGGVVIETPANRGNNLAIPVINDMDLGEKSGIPSNFWTPTGLDTITPAGPYKVFAPYGFWLSSTAHITVDGSNNLVFTDISGTYLLSDLVGGGGGGSMVYPGAGIPISTGLAWGTSITPSTGYLKYTGSVWEFKNETYSLNNHTHPSDILEWSADRYSPYTIAGAGHLYTGTDDPVHNNRLNFDGSFYTYALYGNQWLQAGIPAANNARLGTDQLNITVASTVRLSMTPNVGDSSGAIAYIFDTFNALNTTGAKLVTVKNSGVEKLSVDKDGNINIPTGAQYKVNNIPIGSGVTKAEAIAYALIFG